MAGRGERPEPWTLLDAGLARVQLAVADWAGDGTCGLLLRTSSVLDMGGGATYPPSQAQLPYLTTSGLHYQLFYYHHNPTLLHTSGLYSTPCSFYPILFPTAPVVLAQSQAARPT